MVRGHLWPLYQEQRRLIGEYLIRLRPHHMVQLVRLQRDWLGCTDANLIHNEVAPLITTKLYTKAVVSALLSWLLRTLTLNEPEATALTQAFVSASPDTFERTITSVADTLVLVTV